MDELCNYKEQGIWSFNTVGYYFITVIQKCDSLSIDYSNVYTLSRCRNILLGKKTLVDTVFYKKSEIE